MSKSLPVSNGPKKQVPPFERPHESVRPAPARSVSRYSLLARRQHRFRHRIRRRPIG